MAGKPPKEVICERLLVDRENKESALEICPLDKDVDSDKGYEGENEVKMRLGLGSDILTEGADFLMTTRQNNESGGWIGLGLRQSSR